MCTTSAFSHACTPSHAQDQKPRLVFDANGRLVWTEGLHTLFVAAVDSLGLDKAKPKTVQHHMGVEGLGREHVKVHLREYRKKPTAGAPSTDDGRTDDGHADGRADD